MRLADGVLLVVDAAEGVMAATARAARQAVAEGLAVTLLISKVDRLILELKLPPADAYYKLKHTIEDANRAILEAAGALPGGEAAEALRLDPLKGNVAFCAAEYGWSFTLESFAGERGVGVEGGDDDEGGLMRGGKGGRGGGRECGGEAAEAAEDEGESRGGLSVAATQTRHKHKHNNNSKQTTIQTEIQKCRPLPRRLRRGARRRAL